MAHRVSAIALVTLTVSGAFGQPVDRRYHNYSLDHFTGLIAGDESETRYVNRTIDAETEEQLDSNQWITGATSKATVWQASDATRYGLGETVWSRGSASLEIRSDPETGFVSEAWSSFGFSFKLSESVRVVIEYDLSVLDSGFELPSTTSAGVHLSGSPDDSPGHFDYLELHSLTSTGALSGTFETTLSAGYYSFSALSFIHAQRGSFPGSSTVGELDEFVTAHASHDVALTLRPVPSPSAALPVAMAGLLASRRRR